MQNESQRIAIRGLFGGITHMKRPRAFTLVELLVVIAIIGVLVALLFGAEYALRRRLFRSALPYRDFREFSRHMIAIGPRLWRAQG